MRKRRYEINSYALYDSFGVEKHLEIMAAKGWMIEEMGVLIWKYRRMESQELRFAVTYDLEMNLYAPIPSENQKRMTEIGELGGWEYVTEWSMMQIFCQPKANVVIPFHTDPEVILKTQRTMGVNGLTIWLVVFLMWTLFAMCNSKFEVYGFSPTLLLMFWGLFFFTAFLAVSQLLCALWYWRSRRAVDHGGNCVPAGKGYRVVLGAILVLAAISLIYWIAVYASPGHLAVGGFFIAAMVIMETVQIKIRNRNRKRGVAEMKNFGIICTIGFVLYYLIQMGTHWMVPFAIERGWF